MTLTENNPYYTRDELLALGAGAVGRDVKISRLAKFYGFKGTIGDYARVDDFAIIKGAVHLGAYIHVASFCLLSGVGGTIRMADFSGISAYTAVYTSSDDYRGATLSNPTVPAEHTRTYTGDVTLHEGALVGAHCVLLPGSEMGECSSMGAMCVLTQKIEPGMVMVGNAKPQPTGKRDVEAMKARMAEVRKGNAK